MRPVNGPRSRSGTAQSEANIVACVALGPNCDCHDGKMGTVKAYPRKLTKRQPATQERLVGVAVRWGGRSLLFLYMREGVQHVGGQDTGVFHLCEEGQIRKRPWSFQGLHQFCEDFSREPGQRQGLRVDANLLVLVKEGNVLGFLVENAVHLRFNGSCNVFGLLLKDVFHGGANPG